MYDMRTQDEIDLSSLDFWARPARERDRSYAVLRRERPISFHRPPAFGLAGLMPFPYSGYWVLATHELVRWASLHPDVLCSSEGAVLEDAGLPADLREHIGSFLAMDGQRHKTLRRLVSSAFTPRNVARIEQQIADQARRIVGRLLDIGDCDFVEQVSMPLPLWTISEMMGIPEGDRDRVCQAANVVVSTADPEFVAEGATALNSLMDATGVLWEAATSLARDRRGRPGDDLMTSLVEAEVDGRRLTDEEIGAFMVLLATAGNDTTRNTISHSMKALSDHPDQRRLLAGDLAGRMPGAIEEFVRWATPVIYFRRTATREVTLAGEVIPAGQTVLLLYESANRDDTVIEDPWRFDISRHPNDHLGFGGGGPHYCMGASLARTQLRCLFGELLTRAPKLEVGEPDYLTSNFIHGVKRMTCRL